MCSCFLDYNDHDHDYGGNNSDLKCYECGEPSYFARECRL